MRKARRFYSKRETTQDASMGSGGHNRLPQSEHDIINRADRGNRNAPDRINEPPIMLGELGDVGQAIWKHYEPMLMNNGTMGGADAMAYYMLCKCYEDWYRALLKCERDGEYITQELRDGSEKHYKAPWATMKNEYFSQLRSMCCSFGLTPVDRGRVDKISKEKKVSAFSGITK